MNLLSHYACSLPFTDPVRLGSVLPDLYRLHRRTPRMNTIADLWEDSERVSGEIAEVLKGYRFHLYVDSLFHKSPLFVTHTRALREAMEAASDESGLRRFFAAHLLLEIYLDHYLIGEIPELLSDYQALIEGGREGLIQAVLTIHPEVSEVALSGFLDRILADRFVEDYRDEEGIFYRAGRILSRMGQRPLNESEARAISFYMNQQESAIRQALLRFVERVQQWQEDRPGWEGEGLALAGGSYQNTSIKFEGPSGADGD